MSEANGFNEQVEEVRRETISILGDLTRKAKEFELPKPPEALEHYRESLEENTYKVLVVGEAKTGKSSFINALIGRDVLPTNVRVTTSQVFNVRPAGQEAFRIRFEDDSLQEITLDDLPRYGSQVLEDAGERPELDQIIRWIEVDEPEIRFLPPGVSLLDTPGLGALYAAHAQITHRFVPQADAVIFVLDSEKPIVQTEVEFIETILDVTSDIFFIQTKIDLYDEEAWRDTLRRNQEILKEKFGDKLTDTNIWPISSELLLKAAESEKTRELYLTESLHKELETALEAFLFRVAGWGRFAEAILLADRYRASARQTLSGRLAGLIEDRKKREDIQKQAADRRRQFESDWGPQGKKRRESVDSIRRTAAQGKKSIREALQPNGRIAAAQREKIESIQSPKEAESFNQTMPDEVVAAALNELRKSTNLAEKRCSELLGPFLEEAETLTASDPDELDLTVRTRAMRDIQYKLWEKVRGTSREFLLGNMAGGLLLSFTLAPLAIAAALGGVVLATYYGWKSTNWRLTRTAQAELNRNLDDALRQVRGQLVETDIETGRNGLADEYFATLERAMLEQIQTIAKQKAQEARAEHARLMEDGNLSDQQRKDSIERTKRQLDEWDEIGKAIEGMSAKLNALDQPPAVAPAAG
jgi:GTPase SAR1 family protein